MSDNSEALLRRMIDEIISMYHTTRLSHVSAAEHVLSKPSVRQAIDAALTRPSSPAASDDAVERVARAIDPDWWAWHDMHPNRAGVQTGRIEQIARAERALSPVSVEGEQGAGGQKCLCPVATYERVVNEGGTCGMGGCPHGGDF